jgi:redox-sensitive bicupin YhaK (pirin superfamily)
MPAVTADHLALPRVPAPAAESRSREAARTIAATRTVEGGGFVVWRPFPGGIDAHVADPFFLLDQMGPVEYGEYEAVGAPWHPHRGFETVTYVLDGEIAHHDSNGGGGVIREGDTQWMTAGSGILHDERPTDEFLAHGGLMHGVQLWVNLPAAQKMVPPRYQAITGENLRLITSPDGGALVRIIAGEVAGFDGPGVTYTPITYAHATLEPGAELTVPWNPAFNAMAYVLGGQGYAGETRRPVGDHELVLYGPGDTLTIGAASHQEGPAERLEVLLLGGLPIREPIAHYGPFLMNTRAEILQAMEDFQSGRMGTIPATDLTT